METVSRKITNKTVTFSFVETKDYIIRIIMDSFSIATYNVHMWSDADYHDNFDRVINVVKVKNFF